MRTPPGLRVSLVAVLLALTGCDSVAFVDRVVVVNGTAYPADVGVAGEGAGWLGLGVVPEHGTRSVGQVIDQGRLWRFRFSYGSHDPVELEISREDLARAAWRVEVPRELETRLRAEDVPLPP